MGSTICRLSVDSSVQSLYGCQKVAFVEQSKKKCALDPGAEHSKQLPEGNLFGSAQIGAVG
jgi:hypothetical protein